MVDDTQKLFDELNNRKAFYDENGQYHNDNGPAVIHYNGDVEYYIHGKKHRLDGPAVIRSDGYNAHYINDKKSRVDGPALYKIIDGKIVTSAYFYNNNHYIKEEFDRLEYTDEDFKKDLLEFKMRQFLE